MTIKISVHSYKKFPDYKCIILKIPECVDLIVNLNVKKYFENHRYLYILQSVIARDPVAAVVRLLRHFWQVLSSVVVPPSSNDPIYISKWAIWTKGRADSITMNLKINCKAL